MPTRVWQLDLDDGQQHTVVLHHGQLSGRRVIRVDGVVVCRSARAVDVMLAMPSEDHFRIGDHECWLVIRPSGGGAGYHLLVDGVAVEPANAPSQSSPSEWIWVLAVPGLLVLFLFVVLDALRRPDQAVADVIPPILRSVAVWVLPPVAGFGAAGLLWFVILDVYGSSRMKRLGRPVLLLLSVAMCVLTIWLWAAGDSGFVGIAQAIRAGAPAWAIAVPLGAVANMIVLACSPIGVYHVSGALAFGLCLLSSVLAGSSVWQVTEIGLRHGPGLVLAPVLALVQTLIAGGLAFREAEDVALDSWLGRLLYAESYGHYRDLYRLAEQHDLVAVGPGRATKGGVWVRGEWQGRPIGIASDSKGLLIQVLSERELWPFWVAVPARRARKVDVPEGLHVGILDARGRERELHLVPPDGEEPGVEAVRALYEAVASGRRFLKARTELWADQNALAFHASKIVFAGWRAREMAGMLGWLTRICETMEALGMTCGADGDSEATAQADEAE